MPDWVLSPSSLHPASQPYYHPPRTFFCSAAAPWLSSKARRLNSSAFISFCSTKMHLHRDGISRQSNYCGLMATVTHGLHRQAEQLAQADMRTVISICTCWSNAAGKVCSQHITAIPSRHRSTP